MYTTNVGTVTSVLGTSVSAGTVAYTGSQTGFYCLAAMAMIISGALLFRLSRVSLRKFEGSNS
jgi:hypothetical protein